MTCIVGPGLQQLGQHSHDDGLCFLAVVPQSWKKSHRYHPLGTLHTDPNLRQALCIIRGCLISSSIEPAYIPLVRPQSCPF
jgi:hypothetical protein